MIAMRRAVLCLAFLFVIQISVPTDAADLPQAAAVAAQSDQQPRPRAELTTQVYDVRDLVVAVPDFTDAPNVSTSGVVRLQASGGGGGGGLVSTSPPAGMTREQRMEQLVKLIEESLSPDTWHESNPEGIGTIREVDHGRLVIAHTAAMHQAISKLLSDLRRTGDTPIRVRAHWVLADRSDLEAILQPQSEKPVAGGPATRPSAIVTIDPAALTRARGILGRWQGELLCTNDQWAYLMSAKTGIISEGSGQDSQNTASSSGIVLDFRATLSDDRSSALTTVAIDLGVGALEKASSGEPATRPASGIGAATPPATAGADDRSSDASNHDQLLRTTVRIPTGKTVLIAGTPVLGGAEAIRKLAGASAASGGNRGAAPQLFLFIEVTTE